jgi:outer membrane protein OmpA-like peptidoglycan-associated protein
MPSVGNSVSMFTLGLCVAAVVLIATAVSPAPATADGQVYGSAQDIAEAQAILRHAGYLALGDYRQGEADEPTVRALRSFQAAHNLKVTGSIDYETRTQLLSHAGPLDGQAANRSSLFEGRARLVLEGVQFDTGTARLKLSSRATLDRVASSLNDWPDARVEIGGHTDSTNTDAYNRKLSRARSAAVCEYLVDKGIASSRLQEKGYGESRPIADNATAAGRAINRRVELVRIN